MCVSQYKLTAQHEKVRQRRWLDVEKKETHAHGADAAGGHPRRTFTNAKAKNKKKKNYNTMKKEGNRKFSPREQWRL